MDIKKIINHLEKEDIFIVILLVISLIFILSIVVSSSNYEEKLTDFGNFSFNVPVGATGSIVGDAIVVKSQDQNLYYNLKFSKINESMAKYNEVLSNDPESSVEEYNSSHILVSGLYDLESAPDNNDYLYFCIIAPKDTFDYASLEFKDMNASSYYILSYEYEYGMDVAYNFNER